MKDLAGLHKELEAELQNILQYWIDHTIDKAHGGFFGKINNENVPDISSPKGSVLNSRILWTFSAASQHSANPVYLDVAKRAYDYFIVHFIDAAYGGVYWTVNYMGKPVDHKKQVYAISFAIYALSEFFLASGLPAAKETAIALFNTIEQYSYDVKNGGYTDAFAGDWSPITDVRLSQKDANEKKTMNTHLHIVEAYSNLYRVWPKDILKEKIKNLLQDFIDHIVDPHSGHLILFFDETWNRKSALVSYGHDIEAAWLLLEAAEIIRDQKMITVFKTLSLKLAFAAKEGLDQDGGLWYEYEPEYDHLVKEKHWWPQAEAMIGFFNAWELSKDNTFLDAAWGSWAFIQKHIIDREHGEWLWGVDENYNTMKNQDKAGLWKCPYHNGRACIELMKRLEKNMATPS